MRKLQTAYKKSSDRNKQNICQMTYSFKGFHPSPLFHIWRASEDWKYAFWIKYHPYAAGLQ